MSQRIPRSSADPLDELVQGVPATRLRARWVLRRQDARSARLARRYGVLGALMAAERLGDVLEPACRTSPPDATARSALDVLWRTLHGGDRGTTHWNPAVLHLHQAHDLRRWRHVGHAGPEDVAALLRVARRRAAAEYDAARSGRRVTPARTRAAVPST